VEALRALKAKYRLVIVSNIDDDLFQHSARLLQTPFDDVITAQQVGAYKPSLRNFEAMLQRVSVAREQILHVAQSLYHDIGPAKAMGLATVWVNRRHGRPGSGATPPASATPDLEVSDLRTLVARIGL
jgi:2-haloacid dehalogenase